MESSSGVGGVHCCENATEVREARARERLRRRPETFMFTRSFAAWLRSGLAKVLVRAFLLISLLFFQYCVLLLVGYDDARELLDVAVFVGREGDLADGVGAGVVEHVVFYAAGALVGGEA